MINGSCYVDHTQDLVLDIHGVWCLVYGQWQNKQIKAEKMVNQVSKDERKRNVIRTKKRLDNMERLSYIIQSFCKTPLNEYGDMVTI